MPPSIPVITPNKEGFSWDWVEGKKFATGSEYALCRCGRSKNKPFCDGTHEKIGFDGRETATRTPYARQAEEFDGPTLVLSDAEDLCAFARFCDPAGKIWSLIEQTDNPKARELVIREANHCPAGRLVVHDKKTRKEIEHKLPTSIGIVEDPALGCSGPLWIREESESNSMTTSLMRCEIESPFVVAELQPTCRSATAAMRASSSK